MDVFKSHSACPVTEQERDWLESGMGWLAKEFGWDRLRNAPVVLPTPEFFPDRFYGEADDVRAMLDRVCGYIGVRPETVELKLYVERNPVFEGRSSKGTAGMYEARGGKQHVWIESATVEEPLALAATIAHELGHVLLLGEGRISTDEKDHEQLTDLVTVFLGLGVLTSNSVVREKYWSMGNWSGWSIGRRGYLTMRQLGYALALFAHVREEWKPAWKKELRLDVRTAFEQSARYLAETRAPNFEPKRAAALAPTDRGRSTGDDEDPNDEVEADGMARCTYCGAEIDDSLMLPLVADDNESAEVAAQGAPPSPRERQHLGVCRECRASIEENCADIEEERRYLQHDWRLTWRILLFVSAFLFWCLVLFLLIMTRNMK